MATQYDDRPIKPDKEYLQKKQQQNLQKKQQNDFLKKHQFQDKVLPCFRQNFNKKKQKKKQTSEKIKSKAQLYEQIKQKNIQKFGKKGDRITQSQKPQPLKRIDPKKITIQYKPKHAIFIDTNQYKLNKKQEIELNKKQQIEANHESKVNETPNKLQSRIVSSQQSAKQKYEKLLEIMRKQKMELTKDKQNFQQQKQKLEFKRYISAQQSIPFIGQIQKSIKQKRQFEKSHRALCKTSKQNEEQTQAQKRKLRQQLQESPKLKTKNYKNLLQIEHKIRSLQQKKQDIQDQVYKSNMHKYTDQDDVVCTKYSIEQVNQIPGFNVECFKDFIDIKALSPENNQSYQIALKVFETGLSIKQAKIKLKAENIYQHAVQNQNILSSVDFKRRFQGTLRITKYNNGWHEVWNPGVQRVMANKAFFYKVIWLKNGDIKQQWSDKKLGSYFSKEKQVVKISFDKNEPIYFFIKLNQLEQYFNDKKVKEVMFKDGRVQTFSTEDDLMNGFTV